MEVGIAVFVLVVVAVIVIRLMAGGMDHDRIKEYITSNGGRVIDVHWDPLGPGWFGDKSDRIYEVRYVDREGSEHHAHCKTSLWTGVYFTEDRIVRPVERPAEPRTESLEEENRRLREELERLKREQG